MRDLNEMELARVQAVGYSLIRGSTEKQVDIAAELKETLDGQQAGVSMGIFRS